MAQGLLTGASKASQVRENINAAKNTLFTQGELALIDQITAAGVL
ncbi:MAG: hypothetical protein RRY14_07395 [Hydrogenoanaerobacterium sp.]